MKRKTSKKTPQHTMTTSVIQKRLNLLRKLNSGLQQEKLSLLNSGIVTANLSSKNNGIETVNHFLRRSQS
jgi:hypothetical protein